MRTRLRDARRAAGYTQYSMAEALGVSRSYYSQIESGAKNPSFRIVLAIKVALHDSDDGLFENTDEKPVRGHPFVMGYESLTAPKHSS